MQDYGGPVGFRMALADPDRIDGIIIQNATIHAEGWNPDVVSKFAPFWANWSPDTEAPVRDFLRSETTIWQYTQGVSLTDRISPDAWINDQAGLDRPGNHDIQLEYLWNYQDNVAQYPVWQSYLADHQPDTLIVWGQNDPFFSIEGVDRAAGLGTGCRGASVSMPGILPWKRMPKKSPPQFGVSWPDNAGRVQINPTKGPTK